MECTPVILAHETPFSIGAVEISPATRELRNNGKSAILEPRVMQVLVALHRAKGSVVSKDDLVACCWEGRIVGDDAINRVIGRLRHDASDHADDAFRVETITRVGYRMVENGGSGASAIDRRRLVIGGATAVAAAGVGAFGWQFLGKSQLSGEAKSLVDDGRAALWEGTPEQVSNAVAKLQSASQLAPKSAETWGLLALAYRMQLNQIPEGRRALTTARADAAASRALVIDPNNGDALAAKVWSKATFGQCLSLEQSARSALKHSPDHPVLNKTLGTVLTQVGRLREALFYFDRALKVMPTAPWLHMFRSSTLWDMGRLDEADREIEESIRLWPRHYGIWFGRYYFLMHNGRPDESLAMIRDESSRPLGIPVWNLDLTAMQAEAVASGDPAKIDATVAKWREAAHIGSGFAENASIFAAMMGRLDTAFEILDAYYFDRGFRIGGQRWSKEQGIYAGRGDRYCYFLFKRGMESFRRDPRFAKLTRETGLDRYWRESGTKPDYLA